MSQKKAVNNFVVYAYSRKGEDAFGRVGTFYYIGKGRPKRPYSNNRGVKKPKDRSRIHILHKNLEEKTAFEYEIGLILLYGRADLYPKWGTLRNYTNGGEGCSGRVMSEEELKKRAEIGERSKKPRNWFHIEHGLITGISTSELVKMYPEQNLNFKCLSSVALGSGKNEHKGWIYVNSDVLGVDFDKQKIEYKLSQEYFNGEVNGKRVNSKRGKLNWSHEVYGFVPNKSCSDLIKDYPGDGLWRSCFSLLVRGKLKQYRGWVFIDNSLLNENPSNQKLEEKFSANYAKRVADEARKEAKDNQGRRSHSLLPFKYRNWCHIEHGFVPDKPLTYLINNYPEEKLDSGCLSKLISGEYKSHKGWVYIHESLIDKDLTEDELGVKFSKDYAKDIIESSRKNKLKNLTCRKSTGSRG
jgi:hypothetical protein